MNPGTQGFEIVTLHSSARRRLSTGQQQATQMLPILILANQLTHIFTAGAVAALADLIIDKGLESVRQGDVHGAHGFVRF